MAELTAFGYFYGTSLLHRLDARFKIACLVLLSFVGLKVYFRGLAFIFFLLVALAVHCRLPLNSALKELRYFFALLLFVFVACALSTDGPPEIDLKLMSVSVRGLSRGALVCWRLIFVVLQGFAFMVTTRPSQIKAAVQWFLKPVPLISEKKVATMMGLILRFIPVIFEQARETSYAQKARGVENRKNPVYRLIKLGFPLMRRTFERADHLVAAMEARGFSEHRTDPELVAHKRDWIALTIISCLSIIVLLFFNPA